jgi:hypothetical protein
VRTRRRTLLLGLAVLGGIVAALLWRTPSEAERAIARIEVGMPLKGVDEVLRAVGGHPFPSRGWGSWLEANAQGVKTWSFQDGSYLYMTYRGVRGEEKLAGFSFAPPPRVDPLAPVRRTLARALPFLGE